MIETLNQLLSGMKPLLAAQGKEIAILEATNDRIALALRGFCGGCDCSSHYAESLKDLLNEKFPHVKEIAFELE